MGTTISAPLDAGLVRSPPGHRQSGMPPNPHENAPSTLQPPAGDSDRANRPEMERPLEQHHSADFVNNSTSSSGEMNSNTGVSGIDDDRMREEGLGMGEDNFNSHRGYSGGYGFGHGSGVGQSFGSEALHRSLSSKRTRDGEAGDAGPGATEPTIAPAAESEVIDGEAPANPGPIEGPLRKRRAREVQEAEAAEAEARASIRGGGGELTNEETFSNADAAAMSSAVLASLHTTMPGTMSSGVTLGDASGSGVLADGFHRGGGYVGSHGYVIASDGRGRGAEDRHSDDSSFTAFPANSRGGDQAAGDVNGVMIPAIKGSASDGVGNNAVVHCAVPGQGAEMMPDGSMCAAAGAIANAPASGATVSGPNAFSASSAAVGIAPPSLPASPSSNPAMPSNSNAVGVVSAGPVGMQMQIQMSSSDFIGGNSSMFLSQPAAGAPGGAPHSYHAPSVSGGLSVSSSGMFPSSYNYLSMPHHSGIHPTSGNDGASGEAAAVTAAAAVANAAFAVASRSSFSSGGGGGGGGNAGFPTMSTVSTPGGVGGLPPDYEGALGGIGGGGGALAPLTAIFLGSPPPPAMPLSGGAVSRSGGHSTGRGKGHSRKRSGDGGTGGQHGGGEAPRRNRSRPTCTAEGCQQRPLFGIEGTKQAIFCSQHKAPGMTNVLCRRCEVSGCKHQPSFAVEGSRAVRCATHKTPDMVNVAAPRCKSPGCMVCPSFGKQGERKASFCATHRREGDVDLVTRRCHHEGCVHRPVFGHPPEKKAFYCASHKLEGMVNVFAPRCAYPECTHQPSYGLPGSKRSTHCGKHRTQFHENKR